MRPDTEQRVEDAMKYVWDFHEANGEWPTRSDYADFLGHYDRRSVPGIRAAINRGLLRYGDGDHLVPTEAHNQDRDPASMPGGGCRSSSEPSSPLRGISPDAQKTGADGNSR